MDREELLLDIIHRIEHKVDDIETQVRELNTLKNRIIGIVTVGSVIVTLAVNYLQRIF